MKKILATIAGLAFVSAAWAASVDPTLPMVTGRGNVSARPVPVVVTHQTAASTPAPTPDETLQLQKFVVTGSLIREPAKQAKDR
jgi:hypothetical protein